MKRCHIIDNFTLILIEFFFPFKLQRFLSSGNFYFSNSTVREKTFDLTVSSQRKQTSEQMEDDFRFFWLFFF